MAWNDKRPMSPHLQIYKLPLTAYLSIFHRITGVINTFALLLLVWVLVKAAGTADSYALAHTVLSSWFGKLVLFGFTATLYYHLCNGIRHLFWDVGHGFELSAANFSGKLCLGAAATLTVITWIAAGLGGGGAS